MPFWPSLRTSARRGAALAAVLVVAAAACKGGDPETAVVAEVGDREITVGQVADYMAGNRYGVNEEAVTRAVDEMINIALLAIRARARYTPTRFDSVRMKEWTDMLTLNQFREDVLWKDVVVDETRLRQWYDENVSEEVQARHILLTVAPEASDAEKGVVRQKADSLLRAAQGGADFAELARTNSQDEGSGQNGGLLRWFGRGQMVPPFEEAAFAGEIGEVYPEIVETQFGFHILSIEGRRKPPYEDLRDGIEEQLLSPERFEAEQAYVTRLMETSAVQFNEAGLDTLIALMDTQPARVVTGDHRAIVLAEFRGGRITLGEIWDLYEDLPPSNRQAIEALDQTQMVQAMAAMVQQRLMLQQAETSNVVLDTTRQRQLDERIERLYVEGYMNDVARSYVVVADSTVARYYEEHREFYAGTLLEEVEEDIRGGLQRERFEALQSPDAERRVVAAVADSQRAEVDVEKHEDRYDDVLAVLRQRYEEAGMDPAALEAAAQSQPMDTSGAQSRPTDETP